jgi:CBS domain containing-hemolysin-like protein
MNIGALVVAALLVIVNGVFVATEFALIASQRAKLELLAVTSRRARRASAATRDLSNQLAAMQLGITVASLGLGALGEPTVARGIQPILEALQLPHGALHPVSLVIALAVVSFAHVLIGEMVPKSLALADPERALLLLVPLSRNIGIVLRPLTRMLAASANGVVRLLGGTPVSETGTALTAGEFAVVFDASRDEGTIFAFEHAVLSGALALRVRTTASVTIPGDRVVTVPRQMPVAQIEALALRTGHSRLPVVGAGGLGDVQGFVHVKDLIGLASSARDRPLPPALVRPMLVVRPELALDGLLRAMRRSRSHVALVRGGSGIAPGLVTLEDALESLVGDIRDETDRELPARPTPRPIPGSTTRPRPNNGPPYGT